MSQVGEFFYVVAERECLMPNNKTFKSHTNCECYKSKKIKNPVRGLKLKYQVSLPFFSLFPLSVSIIFHLHF